MDIPHLKKLLDREKRKEEIRDSIKRHNVFFRLDNLKRNL